MNKELFLNKLRVILADVKRVVIVSHVNPDGDAVGSSLAFYFFLQKLGIAAKVILPNGFPSFLSWIPGANDILLFDKNTETSVDYITNADLICYLDFNSPSRTGLMHNDLCHTSNIPKILIDHHREADLSQFVAAFSEIETSSTSELVAEIIRDFGFDMYLDDVIATCILVGIMTDTGCFSHSIFSNKTFEICSQLVSKNVDYPLIHNRIYNTFSENKMRLLGYCINKMTVLDDYHTAIISLSKEELEMFDYHVGDTEGVVNYPLMIDGINMSVLLTERQGVIRLSFRSKGSVSVHEIAKSHFNGGGHTNAAGGTLSCHLNEAVDFLVSVLPNYKSILVQ
ncbi:MAG: bifunctional oligoribonuclease/PAP phosphatase NrnA [Candidatus Limimorpha sp.]